MKQFFKKETNIPPCSIYRADLFDLISLITSDFSSEKKLTISTACKDITIFESSLNDFLNHKELPVNLTHLTIDSSDYSSGEKRISLNFYKDFILLDVSGDSEIWVKGKFQQLIDFLKTKKSTLWFFGNSISAPYLQGFLRGFFESFFIVLFGYEFYNHHGFFVNVPLFLAVIFVLVFNIFLSFAYRIQIKTIDKLSFLTKYNNLIIIISFIASIVTIMDVLIHIFTK
jgi:hypothetical protein